MYTLWVNGKIQSIGSDQLKSSLLDYLRDTLKLTGTKCGCDTRNCGACTVVIDGEAVRSCNVTLEDLEGKQITTIEGLAKETGELHPLQKAFIECNAVQCGFCTPGQLMAAKTLLEKNSLPTENDIVQALKINLCRCGTYPRVIQAIQMAAAELRGETSPCVMAGGTRNEGGTKETPQRVDVLDKVSGKTQFVADLYFKNMLYGKAVWSEYPHAEIISIDTHEVDNRPGVRLVLTSKDIPGINRFGVLEKDQPVLAEDKVRYIGEPVAVVFADDQATAEAAAKAIKVNYKELPGIFSPEAALAQDAPRIHEKGNIIKETAIERGNLEEAFRNADEIVEETYTTPVGEHAYLETEGAVAVPREDGAVIIYAGNQSPFADRQQLVSILGLAPEKVIVRHLPAGGAFGGKTELTVHAFVAIAALRTGRPAKMVLARKESLRFHPKRHSFTMRYRIAITKSGKLLGMDIDIVGDGGAYASWSPRVIDTSVTFGTGPYYVPNLKIRSRAVYTNNLVAGAMRGFGATQVQFAVESALDILSRKLKIDPLDLRKQNALDIGLPTTTGQILTAGVGYKQTIDAVKTALAQDFSSYKESGRKIGIGVASGWRSVAGGLGPDELAGASLELLKDGKLLLKLACTEMGQGSHTALCQMASDIVSVDFGAIEVVAGDTENVPFGVGVMASRGVYLWGHATLGASKKMRDLILSSSAAYLKVEKEELDLAGGYVKEKMTGKKLISFQKLALNSNQPLFVEENFALPKSYPILKDTNESKSIDPRVYKTHHSIAYNTTAVAVEIDDKTGKVKLLAAISATDTGKVIIPEAAKTQVEGAIIMAMGYALTEEFTIEKGVNKIDSLGKCHIPRIDATPEKIRTIFVDAQDPSGPLGSKGVAEIGGLAVAPAITNAIYDATEVRINELPVKKHAEKLVAR